MNEQDLIRRLQQVEADRFGDLDADRDAVLRAILKEKEALELVDPPMEHHYRLNDPVQRRLVTILLRRYGLMPYRYPQQTEADVMVRLSLRFEFEVFTPLLQDMRAAFRRHHLEGLERVARQALHWDVSAAGTTLDDVPRTRNRRS
jgi:hypothetical protein